MWYRVWGVSVVLISSIPSIHTAFIRCFCGSLDNYTEVCIKNATELVNSPCFDITLDTIIYVPGYRNKLNGNTTTAMMEAYLTHRDGNVCLVNWEKDASAGIIPYLDYPLVVQQSEKVAEDFAKAILDLLKAGLSLEKLLLVGLSLGAHMCGYAGRKLSALGVIIWRIIGLDPAYPEYDGLLLDLKTPLSKSDAKFVYIIHSDPGVKGMKTATGDIDFYPNNGFYQNGTNRQPGCPAGLHKPLSDEDLCSHIRSADLWIESLSNPTGLEASKAPSYDDWVAAAGARNYVTFIGNLTNAEYSGVYYLITNPESPYGRGPAGLVP